MPDSSVLPRGTRLHNGNYAIGEVLGRGGFGITYKGGDLARKRYVAIKEYFPPAAVRHSRAVAMADAAALRAGVAAFLGEARTTGRLIHAGIVGVIESFEENNTAYLVMEWIQGETLEARIARKGRLDEWETLDIATRLADALETVHGAGILHRDIKPCNIVLRPNGHAILIDFGTARAFGDGDGAAQMTQIVTPGYAPLEQYADQARRGPASDIYALAATLYHAMSGRRPTSATDRAADVPLPTLRELISNATPIFADAIMGALAMEIERRPQSARAFAAQLRGQPTTGQLHGQQAPAPRSPSAATAAPLPVEPPGIALIAAPNNATGSGARGVVSRQQTLEVHGAAVLAVSFAPGGHPLISADEDGHLCAWEWRDNRRNALGGGHRGGVLALAFSPDGTLLASGGRDERVLIWDGATLNRTSAPPLATLDRNEGVVRALAFCPVRRELAVADAGAVTLWDADTGAIKARRIGGALALAWAPDGSALAVCGVMSGVLQLWDAADLSDRGAVAAHEGTLSDVAWSPDGTQLATVGSDGAARVWNAAQGTLNWQRPIGGAPCSADWSHDSRILAVARGASVFLWRADGAVFCEYSLPKIASAPNRKRIETARFAPAAQPPFDYVIASAARDHRVDLCCLYAESRS